MEFVFSALPKQRARRRWGLFSAVSAIYIREYPRYLVINNDERLMYYVGHGSWRSFCSRNYTGNSADPRAASGTDVFIFKVSTLRPRIENKVTAKLFRYTGGNVCCAIEELSRNRRFARLIEPAWRKRNGSAGGYQYRNFRSASIIYNGSCKLENACGRMVCEIWTRPNVRTRVIRPITVCYLQLLPPRSISFGNTSPLSKCSRKDSNAQE